MTHHTIPSNITYEYDALRDEMLFRLKVQQDIINYSLLLVGFIASVLSIQGLDSAALLIVLLFGPLAGIFLSFVYLKQHIFIEALTGYITQLNYKPVIAGKISKLKIHPFNGWENYLTQLFYKQKLPTFFTALLGLSEGLFPFLIGTICWLLFIVLRGRLANSQVPANAATNFNINLGQLLDSWAILDGVLLFGALVIEAIIRIWAVRQRRRWLGLD